MKCDDSSFVTDFFLEQSRSNKGNIKESCITWTTVPQVHLKVQGMYFLYVAVTLSVAFIMKRSNRWNAWNHMHADVRTLSSFKWSWKHMCTNVTGLKVCISIFRYSCSDAISLRHFLTLFTKLVSTFHHPSGFTQPIHLLVVFVYLTRKLSPDCWMVLWRHTSS